MHLIFQTKSYWFNDPVSQVTIEHRYFFIFNYKTFANFLKIKKVNLNLTLSKFNWQEIIMNEQK